MKKVIWGTGLYASEFAYAIGKNNIDFFIDNHKEKNGTFYLGKKVFSPEKIKNWEELYLYIPYNFYDEITKQLKEYGATNDINFQKYYEVHEMTSTEFEREYESALKEVQYTEQMKDVCLFWGRVWAFENKGYREYIQEWRKKDINLNLGLVSEAVWYSKEETERIMNLPAIVTPGIFDDNIYITEGKLEESQIDFLKEKKYAYHGAECLKVKFPGLAEDSAYYMIYYMYQYVINVLDILHPKSIIVYALFMVQHFILEEICIEKEIPLITTHQGLLPGTLAFDIGGEVGRSLPALYSKEFLKLSVSTEDITYAKKVWRFLYESRLNRKIQQKNNCIEYIIEHIDKDKPIIFFAGQNDINSNMVPYRQETRKYHSPIFKSSIDAGIYLAELCKKNGWNFLYKPHPMRTKLEKKERLPDNTIYVEFGDINDLIDVSDVVITILSQTNYNALIRYKPVVMLGYSQAKGKGFTYEAFSKELIEEMVCEAINKGFTKEQKVAFLMHIAQVLKYYLFDDLTEREIRYGRKVPCDMEEFYELEKLLKESGDKE